MIGCQKRVATERRWILADYSSQDKSAVAVGLFLLLLLLQKHRRFLLHEIRPRKWARNFDAERIWFLHVNRDLIRYRDFVRDLLRVRNCLLNRVRDIFLHDSWIRLGYFNRLRLFNLQFHWNSHWV